MDTSTERDEWICNDNVSGCAHLSPTPWRVRTTSEAVERRRGRRRAGVLIEAVLTGHEQRPGTVFDLPLVVAQRPTPEATQSVAS